MYSLFSYYCTISTKCLATVTRDGKCSVFLSSDLSRMCDMDKVFSSAQIYLAMLSSFSLPSEVVEKQVKTDPIQTQYAPEGVGKGTESYLLDVLLDIRVYNNINGSCM